MNTNYLIILIILGENIHYISNNIILTLTLPYGYVDGYLAKKVG